VITLPVVITETSDMPAIPCPHGQYPGKGVISMIMSTPARRTITEMTRTGVVALKTTTYVPVGVVSVITSSGAAKWITEIAQNVASPGAFGPNDHRWRSLSDHVHRARRS
jgi:hypothetical protein